jgi:hypothetical protein
MARLSRKERLRKDARLMQRRQRCAGDVAITGEAKAGFEDLPEGDQKAILNLLDCCSRSGKRNLVGFLNYARWLFEDHGLLQPEDGYSRGAVYLLASMGLFQISDDVPLSAKVWVERLDLLTPCEAVWLDPGPQLLSCLNALKQKIPGSDFDCRFDGEENEQAGIAYNFLFRCTALKEGETEAK